MPIEHVEGAEPQVADDLDALDGVDVGVHVAHPHAVLVQVLGEVLGHALGQRGDEGAVAPRAPSRAPRPGGRRPGERAGRISTDRVDEAGRADDLLDEDAAGLLHLPLGRASPRRAPMAGRMASHSSKRSGRLSMQEGRRKPYSASVALRRKSPRYMPPICGIGDVALVGEDEGVVGQVLEQGRRRLAGLAAGEVARVVLDAVAGARGLDHLEVEGACAAPGAAPRAAGPCGSARATRRCSSSLMPLTACCRVGRGVT